MCNSAVGMDKLSAKDLLSWVQASIAGIYNLMLATESNPKTLSTDRVTFIPKTETPTNPSEYRSIDQ